MGMTATVFVLKLEANKRYELSSMAGVIYGDWSISGNSLNLKATGMDDGYSKSTNDPSWTANSRPIQLNIVSKDEISWALGGPQAATVTFKKP